MTELFTESVQIVEGFVPVDLSSGANTGDWVNLASYRKCNIVFCSAVGTAGDDPTVTVLQATDNSGSGSKALNLIRAYKKQAAVSLASVAAFSDASGDLSTNTMTNATAAEQDLIWVIEIRADELDVDGGFTHVQASVADVGVNAQLGALLYVMSDPVRKTAVASMPSAIG